MSKRHENFIAKAKKTHGDKYDYSETIYINSRSKIKVRCRIHGIFEVFPIYHLRGSTGKSKCSIPLTQKSYGCKSCSVENRKQAISNRDNSVYFRSQERFLELAKEAHGDSYTYEKAIYRTAQEKLTITCPSHGYFERTPLDHTYRKRGCNDCAKEVRREAAKLKFIQAARQVHGGKYDYSLITEFTNNDTAVNIVCKQHGLFHQTPGRHLSGRGCRSCGRVQTGIKNRTDPVDFLEKAKAKHGDNFDYSKANYTTMKKNVTVICKFHGEIQVTPSYHLANSGCYECGKDSSALALKASGGSWICTQWLDDEAVEDREVRVPGLNLIADGFDAATQTVYEFYGCFWHGCLTCQAPSYSNTVVMMTAQELNDKTVARETQIKAAGFNLKTVWECVYKAKLKALGRPVKPDRSV